jgi:hypothetical protein
VKIYNLFFFLGAGESGKSTILKQMKLIHAAGFSSVEKETYRSIVFLNIVQSMHLVLEAMENYKIPIGDEDNRVNIFPRTRIILSYFFGKVFNTSILITCSNTYHYLLNHHVLLKVIHFLFNI